MATLPFSGATPQPANTAECARRMTAVSAGAPFYFRRDVMNLAALPDDATRTADFGDFPGEDDGDDETTPVTEAEAIAAVSACLAGYTPDAYGETPEYWCEALLDHICEPSDFRVAFRTLLGQSESSSGDARRLQESMNKFVHDHACSLISKTR